MKLIVFVSLLMFSCVDQEVASQKMTLPYDLLKPAEQYTLPAVLHEVSGVTWLDSTSVACVQDEHGIVFIYDLRKKEITRELAFGYEGDYEGVTIAGRSIYILRSDGGVYEIPDYRSQSTAATAHAVLLPSSNYEGLCYDSARRRLLISSKGKVDEESREDRFVYAFDLATKKPGANPAFRFSIVDVTQFAVDQKLQEPYRLTPKGRSVPNYVKMRTSELAIHPHTGHLYMLAAADHMLLVFDQKGRILHIEKLDQALFNQAEGLTFSPEGDMIITNEGGEDVPTMLRFAYKP